MTERFRHYMPDRAPIWTALGVSALGDPKNAGRDSRYSHSPGMTRLGKDGTTGMLEGKVPRAKIHFGGYAV